MALYHFEQIFCSNQPFVLKLHIADSSPVADHCSSYALSDPKETCLAVKCGHSHDEHCQSCDELKFAIKELESAILVAQLTTDDRDDLTYLYKEGVKAINAWKAHQLRSLQQDKARRDILEKLDSTSVLLTEDWAMKFLPQRYRETQTDWFAKRGISWHITVVTRKVDAKFQHQILVHIIEQSNQGSDAVAQLMKHTLTQLKKECPELKTAYLRQDNAGCYHSAEMLVSCRPLKESGIIAKRVDFSDPQGGKGPCDRYAAAIKAHVRRYINEGHDVLTGTQLKEAILSHSGVRGVRVCVVQPSAQAFTTAAAWPKGINSLR